MNLSNETSSVAWLIDDEGPYEVDALLNGTLPGYSSNGNNIIVEDIIMNDDRHCTEYKCCVIESETETVLYEGSPIFLVVAGE